MGGWDGEENDEKENSRDSFVLTKYLGSFCYGCNWKKGEEMGDSRLWRQNVAFGFKAPFPRQRQGKESHTLPRVLLYMGIVQLAPLTVEMY